MTTVQYVKPKTMKEINQKYEKLFFMLEEAAQSENMLEAMQEINEALAIDQIEFKEKAAAYAYRIKEFKATADFLKSEAKAFLDKAKRHEAAAEHLYKNISQALELRGLKKIDLGQYTLSFRKSEAVEITDENMIPDCYVRQEIVSKVDKLGIKQAIKDGEKVSGAELVERQSLQIK